MIIDSNQLIGDEATERILWLAMVDDEYAKNLAQMRDNLDVLLDTLEQRRNVMASNAALLSTRPR